MPRLFVAIRPPVPICDALIDAMDEGVEGARWQNDEQLHLTLRFVGDVKARLADDIVDVLATIRSPAMSVALATLGTFDRRGRIDSMWIGAVPREPLTALHRKIDHALVRLGLPPEGRAYLPHVTLARFGRRAGDTSDWLAAHRALSLPAFEADTFELIESYLDRDGARYETVATYPLGR